MKPKTILVTGVGGDIGQSIVKCLKGDVRAGRIRLIGCDADPYAAGKKDVGVFYQGPRAAERKAYLAFIASLIKKERVSGIFPSSEPEIMFYDQHRRYFETRGVSLYINSPATISVFFDKYKTALFLKKNGLPYPKTYLLSSYRTGLSFPAIIKPRAGCGGKGFIRVTDAGGLRFYKQRMRGAVIQEQLGSPDREYTVGVFSDGTRTHAIAFERVLGYGSMTKVGRLFRDEALSAVAVRIARACRLEGSLNIQMRKTRDGYVPFEINPRLSSTVYFRHVFGFQDVRWWLRLAQGQPVTYVPRYKSGVAVRTIGEVFFELQR